MENRSWTGYSLFCLMSSRKCCWCWLKRIYQDKRIEYGSLLILYLDVQPWVGCIQDCIIPDIPEYSLWPVICHF